jgi:hypothetical protein
LNLWSNQIFGYCIPVLSSMMTLRFLNLGCNRLGDVAVVYSLARSTQLLEVNVAFNDAGEQSLSILNQRIAMNRAQLQQKRNNLLYFFMLIARAQQMREHHFFGKLPFLIARNILKQFTSNDIWVNWEISHPLFIRTFQRVFEYYRNQRKFYSGFRDFLMAFPATLHNVVPESQKLPVTSKAETLSRNGLFKVSNPPSPATEEQSDTLASTINYRYSNCKLILKRYEVSWQQPTITTQQVIAYSNCAGEFTAQLTSLMNKAEKIEPTHPCIVQLKAISNQLNQLSAEFSQRSEVRALQQKSQIEARSPNTTFADNRSPRPNGMRM